MAEPKPPASENEVSRDRLAELLNEDLSREYQARIIKLMLGAFPILSGVPNDSRTLPLSWRVH